MITRLHYSDTTRDERKRKLRHIIKKGYDIDNPDKCYDFFVEKIKEGVKATGLNHYIKALNAYYKYKKYEHRFVNYKENYKPIKIPTKEEVKNIIKYFDRSRLGKTLKTMTFVLANTGLRISELCNIKLDDVDYNRNAITVMGKGNKTRVVPVKEYVIKGHKHPSINNYIKFHRKQVKNNNYLFAWNGGNITPAMYRKYFKIAARRTGSPWMHPHSIRHYYATMLLKKNVNVKIVQIILGHSTIKTTSRYLHMLDNDIFQAINDAKFDDVVYSLTNPIGGFFYGPAEIYNFLSLDDCQGGGFFVQA